MRAAALARHVGFWVAAVAGRGQRQRAERIGQAGWVDRTVAVEVGAATATAASSANQRQRRKQSKQHRGNAADGRERKYVAHSRVAPGVEKVRPRWVELPLLWLCTSGRGRDQPVGSVSALVGVVGAPPAHCSLQYTKRGQECVPLSLYVT